MSASLSTGFIEQSRLLRHRARSDSDSYPFRDTPNHLSLGRVLGGTIGAGLWAGFVLDFMTGSAFCSLQCCACSQSRGRRTVSLLGPFLLLLGQPGTNHGACWICESDVNF
eukprot:752230-Amphidinium_carterae.1